jgi:ribonuclease VapC
MTLDSSALISILFSERGHLDLIDRILVAESVRVAAPTLVETSMVLAGRRRTAAVGEVDALLQELGVTVVPSASANGMSRSRRSSVSAVAATGRR